MGSSKGPWVLGISASHNGGACLLKGNEIVVAIQEERLSGCKRERVFGASESLAVAYCLKKGGISPKDLGLVVVATQGRARTAKQDIFLNPQLQIARNSLDVITVSHHLAHAASAYALSGFKRSAILVVDGLGSPLEDFNREERLAVLRLCPDPWEHISFYAAEGTTLTPVRKHVVEGRLWLTEPQTGMASFGSVGGMYSAVTQQIFGDPMEAGQVMGLAPYGRPIHAPEDFFHVSKEAFVFHDTVPKCYRHNRRWPQCKRNYEHLACSVQAALHLAIQQLVNSLRKECPSENLCYAGGVALNGSVNEDLHRTGLFKKIFVPAAAEDSGAAIGAAFIGLWKATNAYRPRRTVTDALGMRYGLRDISVALDRMQGIIRKSRKTQVIVEAAERISAGQLCGWFQRGAEFGPRALGQRSILADPRDIGTKRRLNEVIKRRAGFRPFAPSILEEEARGFVKQPERDFISPFMLRVCPLTPQAQMVAPAISHIDGTARIHTVNRAANPRFYHLIEQFGRMTGVPILLNTSFNARGEPIVETPDDALWCFYLLGLDFCVIENALVEKNPDLSPLDLYAVITCPSYSIVTRRGDESRGLRREATQVVLQFETPWGRATRSIGSQDFSVFRAVDGRTNGWELVSKLAATHDGITASTVIDSFIRLRRMSSIMFSRNPWT